MPSFTLPCPHCGTANEDVSGVLVRARGAVVWLACKRCGKGFGCSLRDCVGRSEGRSSVSPAKPADNALSRPTSAGREGPQARGHGAQDLLDANLELAEYLASGLSEQDLHDLDTHYCVSSHKGHR